MQQLVGDIPSPLPLLAPSVTALSTYSISLVPSLHHSTRITNSPIADLFVVWAKTQDDDEVRGFLLEKVRYYT